MFLFLRVSFSHSQHTSLQLSHLHFSFTTLTFHCIVWKKKVGTGDGLVNRASLFSFHFNWTRVRSFVTALFQLKEKEMREVCCVVRPSSISLFFRPHTKEQLNKWNKTNERQRMRVCFIIFNLVFWLWFFFFPLFSLTFSLHWNKGKQKWPQGTNEVNNNKSVLRSSPHSPILLFSFLLINYKWSAWIN